MTLLDVRAVSTAYGAIAVNHQVSLSVAEGEIVTILGPNGAGKTTLLRSIAGLLRPLAGSISFDGAAITGEPADRIAARGVVMVPEGRRIFSSLTVRDNLRLGAYARTDREVVESDLNRMETYFPILAQKRTAKGGELSGGQQQMLAIARGLMARPRVLLLDEPSLGLSPLLVKEVRNVVLEVRKSFGASVLLVEQNAGLAFAVSDRGYLMNNGRIVTSGPVGELRDARLVRELYLGHAAPASREASAI
jgi:branched-chain amino acid transport system ATP-binding protein